MNGFDYFEKGLKQFADFKGRASRTEFWYFMLFNFLGHLSISIFAGIVESEVVLGLGNGIFALAMLVPRLAVSVRRLHDSGKSGWFMLFMLFPPCMIVLFIFFLLKSDPTTNKWGSVPGLYNDGLYDDDEDEFLEDFGIRNEPIARGKNRRY